MSSLRPRLRYAVVFAAIVSTFLLGSGSAVALITDVDPGFGEGGATSVPIKGPSAVGGIVQRDDGVFVIGGSVGQSFMTVALAQSGDLLDSYGNGGMSSVLIPGASDVTATDVALQENDRVVVAGYESGNTGSDRFVVARFRAGGAPDESFSDDGVAFVTFSQGDAYGYGVTVQPTGAIAVVGEVDPAEGVSNPAIARFDPDGSLDRSFGDHGRAVVRVPDGVRGYDSPWRVVSQSHGRLAMAGWAERGKSNYKTLAMRLRSDGSLDTSFSHDGAAIVDADGIDNYAYGLAEDGAKLVMGVHTSNSDAAFVRLDGDGSRDSTFGGDGVAVHTLSIPWEVRGVAVLPDHRVIGVNGFSSGPNIAVLRPRGALDTAYSGDGEGVGPYKGANGEGLVLLANGKVVVAGQQGSTIIATRFSAP
jgi:uncharacterized delta-60 repeat protein